MPSWGSQGWHILGRHRSVLLSHWSLLKEKSASSLQRQKIHAWGRHEGNVLLHLEDKFLTTLKCQPQVELLTEDSALHSPHYWPAPDCLCPGPPGAHWKAV